MARQPRTALPAELTAIAAVVIGGARLTGGGFGGCTVNLVHANEAEEFANKLLKDYLKATGIAAELYHCHAAAGAHQV